MLRRLWERPFCGTEWESEGSRRAKWVTAQAGTVWQCWRLEGEGKPRSLAFCLLFLCAKQMPFNCSFSFGLMGGGLPEFKALARTFHLTLPYFKRGNKPQRGSSCPRTQSQLSAESLCVVKKKTNNKKSLYPSPTSFC